MLTTNLSAQLLEGKILDINEEAVPNAVIYIQELSQGIMADENGSFRTQINKGNYTCEITSLGYEKQTINISVPEEGLSLKINLQEKIYSLHEVSVTPGKEDPAYAIMRKVIAKAPYHLHRINSYESEVYLKGKFKIEKIPGLIKRQIKDKTIKDMIGRLLIVESQNEVKYQEPNKYEQRVIARSSSLPEDIISDNELMSIIMNNIYSPASFGGVLAPGSFSIYKFRLEDYYTEGGHQINKISVIPKKKNGKLVSGTLYISEDTWAVVNANLKKQTAGLTTNFNLSYNEIKPDIFLPTAYDMSVKLNLMGVKGNGQFYASVQYNKLETNNKIKLSKPANTNNPIISIQPDKKPLNNKQKKNLKKLEELAGKETLTTREAYKMAKLMSKVAEPNKKQKNTLELPSLDSLIKVSRDSMALLRDSGFWETVRKHPLRPEEIQSYIWHDSITSATNLKDSAFMKKRSAGTWIKGFLFGEQLKLNDKASIRYGGFLEINPEYNFVDGFWLGGKISTRINLSPNHRLYISPKVYYTTARKKTIITADASLTYAPMRNGRLFVSTGNTSEDFAGTFGTNRFINATTSLFAAENTAKFYKKTYLHLSNDIDIANGLKMGINTNYEKRQNMVNNTQYSFFAGKPEPNIPYGQTSFMPKHEAFTAEIAFEYTPKYYYRIRKGRKYYSHSSYPTIRVSYKKAFPFKSKINASFDKIEASLFQEVRTGLFSRLSYNINAGMFASSSQTYLPDYRHFNTSELIFTDKRLYENFSLLENYRYATNDKWIQAHINYTSEYLAIKQVPFLQRFLFDEALHVRTLLLPDKNYLEAGYSVGFSNLGRIGIFAGFDKYSYERMGFTISVPLLKPSVNEVSFTL